MITHHPEAEKLDAKGQLVLPGSICGHTHFYGAFARGMAIPGEPAKNFVEILEKLWWRLDRALDEESIRLSALVCLIDAIRNGTTTLIDHHASPNLIDGSLDICADAIVQSGLRVCECYEVTDRNGPDGAKAGIAENVRFAKSLVVTPRTVTRHFSPPLSVCTPRSPSGRRRSIGVWLKRNRFGLGFHIHVAEDAADEVDSRTQLRAARRQALVRTRRAGREDDIRALRPRQRQRDQAGWRRPAPRSAINRAAT